MGSVVPLVPWGETGSRPARMSRGRCLRAHWHGWVLRWWIVFVESMETVDFRAEVVGGCEDVCPT